MYVSFLVIKGQQKGDHFHMWSMSFAVGHRVDTIKFSDPSTLMAQNIPPDSYAGARPTRSPSLKQTNRPPPPPFSEIMQPAELSKELGSVVGTIYTMENIKHHEIS